MGGFGAGGQTQSGSSAPPPTSVLNPLMAVLAQMFGQNVGMVDGGFSMLGPEGSPRYAAAERQGKLIDPLATQVFGPGSFEPIADLLTPQNIGAPAVPGLMGDILGGAQQGQQFFDDVLYPTATEGLQTGFPTDTNALADRMVRQAQGNIANQFGQSMGGLSTDFLSQMGETEADIRSQLGFQAEEAAAGRRADLLPAATMLPSARASLAFPAASQLLNLGEQLIMDATPGGRAASMMQMLAGMQPTSAIPRGNFSDQSGLGWNLSGSYGGGGQKGGE